MKPILSAAVILLMVGACQRAPEKAASPTVPMTKAAAPAADPAPDETPVDPMSAQGAAEVAQMYFSEIEDGDYQSAWSLWGDDGKASGMDAAAFAHRFDRYESYHATVGSPGRIEGAAGSLYVQAPLELEAVRKDGSEKRAKGTVTLRRVNDVPGADPEQLEWHIAKVDLADEG